MTTVINTPPQGSGSNDSSGMGMVIGAVALVVVLFLLFFYGMPYFRGNSQQNSAPAPAVQMPDKIDVNVNKTP